jgi:hypothetical protein
VHAYRSLRNLLLAIRAGAASGAISSGIAYYYGLEAMPATVKLKDIVDALDEQFDESTYFVNLDTGEIKVVSKDLLREAEEFGDDEEEPDLPKWQEREWELAKRIVSTRSFHHLPSKFDIHEWSIMQNFALSIEPGEIRDDLLDAIHGAGAFRNFKYALRVHRVEPDWFEFRTNALRQIAIDWCKRNDVPWE